MLRPAFAIALPALCLAWFLSQTDLRQRAALVGAFQAAATRPSPLGADTPQVASTPTRPELSGSTFAIDADARGQYATTMLVRGRELPVLIDTGATFVALRYEDAASVGLHPVEADFKYRVQTANGVGRAAAATLPSVRIGNVEVRNVQAVVSQPGSLTGRSLVGMSFLKQLSSFESQSGRLLLRQ